jgi:arsenate reductase
MKDVKPTKDVVLINIKEQNISAEDLDFAAKKLGSYEALFSRKAMKYRELGLASKSLTEQQIRKYILDEYTFLKRPVSIIGDQVFAGITKDAVAGLKEALHGKK